MVDRLKLSLGGVWLIAALSSLLMPFLLLFYAPSLARSAMDVSTTTMFILAFPSGLIANIGVSLLEFVSGYYGSTGEIACLNLFLLFLAGFVQWFWAVPRFFGKNLSIQRLDLGGGSMKNPRLFIANPDTYNGWMDAQGTTPLERVMRES